MSEAVRLTEGKPTSNGLTSLILALSTVSVEIQGGVNNLLQERGVAGPLPAAQNTPDLKNSPPPFVLLDSGLSIGHSKFSFLNLEIKCQHNPLGVYTPGFV